MLRVVPGLGQEVQDIGLFWDSDSNLDMSKILELYQPYVRSPIMLLINNVFYP